MIDLDQIRRASAFANFGDRDPARIVLQGLLAIAGGCRTGYTVQCILVDLGLIGRKSCQLTKLGRSTLLDAYWHADPLAGI